jgi:hypothetical protein
MLSTEQIVDAKFLSVCPPTEAVQWLRAARSSSIGGLNSLSRKDYSHQEQTLADRNDPYIDFGLARYGTSEAAGKIVYARGDLGIRCAYLAHFPGGGFGWRDNFELASSPPQELEELRALVKNPSLADETFKMCFERRGVFETLTDEAFQSVLVAVSDNERLMTPYDDKYMDGYADYSYHGVFEAAWKLTLTTPVTAKWSGVLYHLLYRCLPPHSFDAVAAIKHWYFPPTNEGEIRDYGLHLRSRLADLLKADDALLLESKDAALRTSFYRRFDPGVFRRWPDFVSDAEYFLDNALHNNFLWRSRELRGVLSKLCWDHPDPRSNLEMPNAYNAVEERMLKEHPEWFDDNLNQ